MGNQKKKVGIFYFRSDPKNESADPDPYQKKKQELDIKYGTPSTVIFLFRLKQPVAAIQLPKEGETYYTFEPLD